MTEQAPVTARPLGVTVIAILAAIGGVLGILGSLALIAIGGAAVGVVGGLGGMAMVFGLLTLALSVASLVFAWGAWNLRPWAWTLGVALEAIAIVLAVLQLIMGADFFSFLISVAIAGVILYYLFRPEVQAAFGRR